MKKLLTILAICLAGCATTDPVVDKGVVVRYKYVVTTIPDEMLSIPPPVYMLDLSTATDKDAALWLVESEKRSLVIEGKLSAIKLYLQRKAKELNVPEADLIRN